MRVKLEPVVADINDAIHVDEPARVGPCTAADAGDEEVPCGEAAKLCLRRLRHGGELWTRHDWRQRPVHVEDESALLRPFGQGRKQVAYGHAPRIPS